MSVYGADVAQLRELASDLDTRATSLESISTSLGGRLRATPWEGADAATFRSTWDSDHTRRLADAATRLREAARAVRRNADEQERTSAADGGALGGGTGGAGGSGGGLPGVGKLGASAPAGAGGGGGGGGVGDSEHTSDVGLMQASAGVKDGELQARATLASAQFEDKWTVAGSTVTRSGDYAVGAKAKAGWKFDFSEEDKVREPNEIYHAGERHPDGAIATVGAEASGQAGAWAEDSLKLGKDSDLVQGSAGYTALAGAKAEIGGGLQLTDQGLQAGVTGGAFAGAEATAKVNGDIAGVGGGVEAGVRAGIGADASAHAHFGTDEVKVDFEVGVALGVGFKIKPSISFSPKRMADSIMGLFG